MSLPCLRGVETDPAHGSYCWRTLPSKCQPDRRPQPPCRVALKKPHPPVYLRSVSWWWHGPSALLRVSLSRLSPPLHRWVLSRVPTGFSCQVLLKLFSYCVKVKVNRQQLVKLEMNTLNVMLGTLNLVECGLQKLRDKQGWGKTSHPAPDDTDW